MSFELRDPESIRIGTRHRREIGGLESLADSIARIGLLHPIVVTRQGELVAGQRRLEAWQNAKPGQPIPAHVIDLPSIVAGEFAENVERKDFTLSEAIAIKRALAPELRAEAERRMKAGQPLPNLDKGRTADRAAAYTGFGRTTLDKAEAVVAAAEAEPEKYARLVEQMDRTGRANGVWRRLANMQQAERIRAEPPPLPMRGPYRVSVVDIPWAYEPDDDDAAERGVLPYSTLSIQQACALDVGSIVHADSALFLWVTNFILVRGLHLPVLHAWGFEPKTLVTWPKDRAGQGHYAKGQSEHMVLAVRGKPVVTLTNQTTLLQGPFHLVRKAAHSAKPVEAYAYIESLCPAPRYADVFSRYRHNDRWDCHGDELPPLALEAAE